LSAEDLLTCGEDNGSFGDSRGDPGCQHPGTIQNLFSTLLIQGDKPQDPVRMDGRFRTHADPGDRRKRLDESMFTTHDLLGFDRRHQDIQCQAIFKHISHHDFVEPDPQGLSRCPSASREIHPV
jgi:hypothetical protein